MKNALVTVGIAVAVFVVGMFFVKPVQNVTQQVLGVVPGNDFQSQVNLMGGQVNSTLVSTTSQGASVTVTANEFKGWANAGLVEFKQGLLADSTLTLPASSTLSALVPRAGDRQSFCIRNATSTASLVTILAGSTGVNLSVASSSATALGSTKLYTGEVGCITLVRQSATASSFDIDALLTVFK